MDRRDCVEVGIISSVWNPICPRYILWSWSNITSRWSIARKNADIASCCDYLYFLNDCI
jgi:hypothetical protein